MKIALIARGCRPGAGIERYTFELARRLATRHTVSVLTDPREFETCGQVTLVPIRVPRTPHWHSILNFSHKAGMAASASDYDVVHTQGSDGTWGDVVTAHSCHHAGMRASLKLRPTWINRLRKTLSPAHRAILSLEQGTLVTAQALIGVSERVKRQVRATYPSVRALPFHVVYPGVEAEQYDPRKQGLERNRARAHWGLPSQAVVVALTANALRLKGAERLIRALGHTRQTQIVLMLASSGPFDRSLHALAHTLGLASRVFFVSPGAQVLPVLAAADVYALLPEYESFGLTVLEAAAARLPIVMARNVGAAELFQHEHDAWLLPGGADVKTLARALDTLASHPDLRARLGSKAHLRAEEHSWDKMTRSVESVYRTVSHTQRRRRKGGRA